MKTMAKIMTTAGLLLLLVTPVSATAAPAATPQVPATTLVPPLAKPNIVLINIDTLRAQQMGVYGFDKNTTPFLDSLFRQGVVFDNAVTPAYLTFQTDAAILSGLYPSQNNVMTWLTPINDKLNLLPHILKLYGYRTTAFVSPSLWPSFRLDKQFDEYHLHKDLKNIGETKTVVAEWMNNNKKTPFFLFWHIYDVHIPFMKPSKEFFSGEYNGTFLDEKQWDFVNQTVNEVRARTGAKGPAVGRLSETDIRYLQAAYNTGIQYVDSQLSAFFASISDKEFFKNTLFIISSEHGEDLKEHGFVFHRDLYDVNTRVPLAMIGLPIAPRKIDEAVSSLDIMPTVIELAGGVLPATSEGKSLVPLINGTSLERDIYTERPPFDEYAVRSGRWKYIMRNPAKKDPAAFVTAIEDNFMKKIAGGDVYSGDELYDLATDQNEQVNLVGSGLPVEEELRKKLEEFRARMARAREYNKGLHKILPPGGPLIPYP
jgi:arylsulfatase A-like enzyme